MNQMNGTEINTCHVKRVLKNEGNHKAIEDMGHSSLNPVPLCDVRKSIHSLPT